MTLSAEERTLRARAAAHALHSKRDPHQTTAKARQAFYEKFERQVDPRGELSSFERQRRAMHARKAYFAQLALASARARSAKNGEAPDLVVEVLEVLRGL